MKLLVISNKELNNRKKSLFQSFNIDIIKYTNPLKAMDNFYEISPDVVYFIKEDFPRVWKIVLSSLRENFNKDKSVFILDGGSLEEDRKDFFYLNGNIVIENDSLSEVKDLFESRFSLDFTPTFTPKENEYSIGFVHPETFSFISAQVVKINGSVLIFSIDRSEYEGIDCGISIKNASMELNNELISLDFTVDKVENNRYYTTILNESEKLTTLVSDLFV